MLTIGIAPTRSNAPESSHVLKSSGGGLVSLHVKNGGPAQYIFLIDAAAVPPDGAVSIMHPPIKIAADANVSLFFPGFSLVGKNGIVVCNSSTDGVTKTIGAADCVFTAQVD